MLQVTEKEVERMKAEAEGESGARLLTQRNESESLKVQAEAEAFETRQKGLAHADAVKAQGDAEAAASFLADCTVADARCTDNVTVVVVVLERRDAPELPAEAAAAPEPEAGRPP